MVSHFSRGYFTQSNMHVEKRIVCLGGRQRDLKRRVSDLLTFAEVAMAPAIFICEFMTFVCVDMEVTLELTA
ncbi:hypothetical protein EYF80_010421 [Liparis tanakae]|uniref:Uncharacterized protein n=1 Tax=Liparis tanakae TaxID=230148 RepID=A0A4Z2INN9_9TELE|nr:hypothetical protein EYF80_010421 [Liparis tanakae]